MSEQEPDDRRAIRGTIRRRLLVNALVDPDEAAGRLPVGLRPHVTGDGTVVGCCLLAIERIRPAGVPRVLGMGLRAAAHRISVEWDDESGTAVGVYVPLRHTDSLPARLLGGRWFPGVHRRASIEIAEDDSRLRWIVEPRRDADLYEIRVEARVSPTEAAQPCEPIGGTCLAATVGLSPDFTGSLEAARMEPAHRAAQPVEVIDLDSEYLAGFTTARPATSYLMRDVDVIWTPAHAPRGVTREVPA
jgi:hypothetical protein